MRRALGRADTAFLAFARLTDPFAPKALFRPSCLADSSSSPSWPCSPPLPCRRPCRRPRPRDPSPPSATPSSARLKTSATLWRASWRTSVTPPVRHRPPGKAPVRARRSRDGRPRTGRRPRGRPRHRPLRPHRPNRAHSAVHPPVAGRAGRRRRSPSRISASTTRVRPSHAPSPRTSHRPHMPPLSFSVRRGSAQLLLQPPWRRSLALHLRVSEHSKARAPNRGARTPPFPPLIARPLQTRAGPAVTDCHHRPPRKDPREGTVAGSMMVVWQRRPPGPEFARRAHNGAIQF